MPLLARFMARAREREIDLCKALNRAGVHGGLFTEIELEGERVGSVELLNC